MSKKWTYPTQDVDTAGRDRPALATTIAITAEMVDAGVAALDGELQEGMVIPTFKKSLVRAIYRAMERRKSHG